MNWAIRVDSSNIIGEMASGRASKPTASPISIEGPSGPILTWAIGSWLIGLNASRREEWYLRVAQPGSTEQLPSDEPACSTTTDESR